MLYLEVPLASLGSPCIFNIHSNYAVLSRWTPKYPFRSYMTVLFPDSKNSSSIITLSCG